MPNPVRVKRRHTANFKRNLARTIVLTDGGQLKSLDDARALMLDVFGSSVFHHVIQLLALVKLLRDRRLLGI